MILASWTRRSDAFELPATRLASGRSGHGILPLPPLTNAVRSLHQVVITLLLVAGCGGCGANEPIPTTDAEVRELVAVPTTISNKLDLLFVLGNSLDNQISLTTAFPALLAQVSASGRPDLHIGAITPDMGTSTTSGAIGPPIDGAVGGCKDRGDDGALFRSDVTTGAKFLVDSATQTNHAGTLEGDMPLVTLVGSNGCRYPQDLAAIRAAFTNPLNAGFLRDDAALAIVILADADECSALDPNLFSSDTSQLGPLSTFRCVRFGDTCAEADLTTPGPRTNCVPSTSSTAIANPADFVPVVRAQANDPRRIAVGSIIAPSDVAIELRTPIGSDTQRPAIVHSCSGPVAADPAVRLAWFTNQFGDRGAIGSICGGDLTPAMTTMGIAARRAMGDPCIELDLDLSQCTATEEIDGVEYPLVACASPTETNCFELATDATTCPNAAHRKLVVRHSSTASAGYDLLRCRS